MSIENFDWQGYMSDIGYAPEQIPNEINDEDLQWLYGLWARDLMEKINYDVKRDPFLSTAKEKRAEARKRFLYYAPDLAHFFGDEVQPNDPNSTYDPEAFRQHVINNEVQNANLGYYLDTFAASRINEDTDVKYPWLKGLTKDQFKRHFMEQQDIDEAWTSVDDIRNGNFGTLSARYQEQLAKQQGGKGNEKSGHMAALKQGWYEFEKLFGYTAGTLGDAMGVQWLSDIGNEIAQNVIQKSDAYNYQSKYNESLADTIKNQGFMAAGGKILNMAEENWATTAAPLALAAIGKILSTYAHVPQPLADAATRAVAANVVRRQGANLLRRASQLAYASSAALSGLEIGGVRAELEEHGKYDPNNVADVVAAGLVSSSLDFVGNVAAMKGIGITASRLWTHRLAVNEARARLAREITEDQAKSFTHRVLSAMAIEGVTEGLQEIPAMVVGARRGIEYTPKEVRDRIIDAAAVGAFMGGGIRTGEIMLEKYHRGDDESPVNTDADETPEMPDTPEAPPQPSQPPPPDFDGEMPFNNVTYRQMENGFVAADPFNVGYGATRNEAAEDFLKNANKGRLDIDVNDIRSVPPSATEEGSSIVRYGNNGEHSVRIIGQGNSALIRKIIDIHNNPKNAVNLQGHNTFNVSDFQSTNPDLNENQFIRSVLEQKKTGRGSSNDVIANRKNAVDIPVNLTALPRTDIAGNYAAFNLDQDSRDALRDKGFTVLSNPKSRENGRIQKLLLYRDGFVYTVTLRNSATDDNVSAVVEAEHIIDINARRQIKNKDQNNKARQANIKRNSLEAGVKNQTLRVVITDPVTDVRSTSERKSSITIAPVLRAGFVEVSRRVNAEGVEEISIDPRKILEQRVKNANGKIENIGTRGITYTSGGETTRLDITADGRVVVSTDGRFVGDYEFFDPANLTEGELRASFQSTRIEATQPFHVIEIPEELQFDGRVTFVYEGDANTPENQRNYYAIRNNGDVYYLSPAEDNYIKRLLRLPHIQNLNDARDVFGHQFIEFYALPEFYNDGEVRQFVGFKTENNLLPAVNLEDPTLHRFDDMQVDELISAGYNEDFVKVWAIIAPNGEIVRATTEEGVDAFISDIKNYANIIDDSEWNPSSRGESIFGDAYIEQGRYTERDLYGKVYSVEEIYVNEDGTSFTDENFQEDTKNIQDAINAMIFDMKGVIQRSRHIPEIDETKLDTIKNLIDTIEANSDVFSFPELDLLTAPPYDMRSGYSSRNLNIVARRRFYRLRAAQAILRIDLYRANLGGIINKEELDRILIDDIGNYNASDTMEHLRERAIQAESIAVRLEEAYVDFMRSSQATQTANLLWEAIYPDSTEAKYGSFVDRIHSEGTDFRFSRAAETPRVQRKINLLDELNDDIGTFTLNEMLERGLRGESGGLVILPDQEAAHEIERRFTTDATQPYYDNAGLIQGFVAPDGIMYLVEDGIVDGKARQIILHEYGVHARKFGMSDAEFQEVVQGIKARREEKSLEGDFIRNCITRARRANRNMSEDNPIFWEEVAAYAVEDGYHLADTGIVGRMQTWMKNWLWRFGVIDASAFHYQDFVNMAQGMLGNPGPLSFFDGTHDYTKYQDSWKNLPKFSRTILAEDSPDREEFAQRTYRRLRGLDDAIDRERNGEDADSIEQATNWRRNDQGDWNFRYSFAGEIGATALDAYEEVTTRMDNLAIARQMEEAGKDARAIKYATGWERGADNKWRYEIDDSANTLNMAMLENGEGTLADTLDAPELFRAYPQLTDIQVELTGDLSVNTLARFIPTIRTIQLRENLSDDEARSSLHHEIQHIIQDIEGFAQGGSSADAPMTFAQAVRNLRAGMLSFVNDDKTLTGYLRERGITVDGEGNLSKPLSVLRARTKARTLAELRNVFESQVNQIIREDYASTFNAKVLFDQNGLRGFVEYLEQNGFPDQGDRYLQYANKLHEKRALRDEGKELDAYEWYGRLSGEVEARNVQRRLSMTLEQRRVSLAEETERGDVAREDQIILGNMLNEVSSAIRYSRAIAEELKPYSSFISTLENDLVSQRISGVPNEGDTVLYQRGDVNEFITRDSLYTIEDADDYYPDLEQRWIDYHRDDSESNFVRYSRSIPEADSLEEEIEEARRQYNEVYERYKDSDEFLKVRLPDGSLVNSNLSEHQWVQVRTKNFKDWFGDWENDPENSSKVVDENGEPKVVYHAVGKGKAEGADTSFTIFDRRYAPFGFMFSDNKAFAESWASRGWVEGNRIIPSFLNIRNDYTTDAEGKSWIHLKNPMLDDGWNLEDQEEWASLEESDKRLTEELRGAKKQYITVDGLSHYMEKYRKPIEDNEYGIIIKNVNEGFESAQTDYIVYDSRQINSAVDNVGLFGKTGSRDFRYSRAATIDDVPQTARQRGTQVPNAPGMYKMPDGSLHIEPSELPVGFESETILYAAIAISDPAKEEPKVAELREFITADENLMRLTDQMMEQRKDTNEDHRLGYAVSLILESYDPTSDIYQQTVDAFHEAVSKATGGAYQNLILDTGQIEAAAHALAGIPYEPLLTAPQETVPTPRPNTADMEHLRRQEMFAASDAQRAEMQVGEDGRAYISTDDSDVDVVFESKVNTPFDTGRLVDDVLIGASRQGEDDDFYNHLADSPHHGTQEPLDTGRFALPADQNRQEVERFLADSIPEHIWRRVEILWEDNAENNAILGNALGLFKPRSWKNKNIFIKGWNRSFGQVVRTAAREASRFGWGMWQNRDFRRAITEFYDMFQAKIYDELRPYYNQMGITDPAQLSDGQKIYMVQTFFSKMNQSLFTDDQGNMGDVLGISQTEYNRILADVRSGVAAQERDLSAFVEGVANDPELAKRFAAEMLRMTMEASTKMGVHFTYERSSRLGGKDRIRVFTNEWGTYRRKIPNTRFGLAAEEIKTNLRWWRERFNAGEGAEKFARQMMRNLPMSMKYPLKLMHLYVPHARLGDTTLGRASQMISRVWQRIGDTSGTTLARDYALMEDIHGILRAHNYDPLMADDMGKRTYREFFQGLGITSEKDLKKADMADAIVTTAERLKMEGEAKIRETIMETGLSLWNRMLEADFSQREINKMVDRFEGYRQRFMLDHYSHRMYEAFTPEGKRELSMLLNYLRRDPRTGEHTLAKRAKEARDAIARAQARYGAATSEFYRETKEARDDLRRWERLQHLWNREMGNAKKYKGLVGAELNAKVVEGMERYILAIVSDSKTHGRFDPQAVPHYNAISAQKARTLDPNNPLDKELMDFLLEIKDPIRNAVYTLDQQRQLITKLEFNKELGEYLLDNNMAGLRSQPDADGLARDLAHMETGSFLEYVNVDPEFMPEIKAEWENMQKVSDTVLSGLTDAVKANSTVYSLRLMMNNYIGNASMLLASGHIWRFKDYLTAGEVIRKQFLDRFTYGAKDPSDFAKMILREMEQNMVTGGSGTEMSVFQLNKGAHERFVQKMTQMLYAVTPLTKRGKFKMDNFVAKLLEKARAFYTYGDEWVKPLIYLNNRASAIAKYQAVEKRYDGETEEDYQERVLKKAIEEASEQTIRETVSWENSPFFVRQLSTRSVRFFAPDFLLHNFQMLRITASNYVRLANIWNELRNFDPSEMNPDKVEAYRSELKKELVRRGVGGAITAGVYAGLIGATGSCMAYIPYMMNTLMAAIDGEDDKDKDNTFFNPQEWEGAQRILNYKTGGDNFFVPAWRHDGKIYAWNYGRASVMLTHAITRPATENPEFADYAAQFFKNIVAIGGGTIAQEIVNNFQGKDKWGRDIGVEAGWWRIFDRVFVPGAVKQLMDMSVGYPGSDNPYREGKAIKMSDAVGITVNAYDMRDIVNELAWDMARVGSNSQNIVRKSFVKRLTQSDALSDSDVASMIGDMREDNARHMDRANYLLTGLRQMGMENKELQHWLTISRKDAGNILSKKQATAFLKGHNVYDDALVTYLKNKRNNLAKGKDDVRMSREELGVVLQNYDKAIRIYSQALRPQ